MSLPPKEYSAKNRASLRLHGSRSQEGAHENQPPTTGYQPRTQWEIEEEAKELRWEMRFGPPFPYIPPQSD